MKYLPIVIPFALGTVVGGMLPKLKALVQSYAAGIDTETAIRQVLGIESGCTSLK